MLRTILLAGCLVLVATAAPAQDKATIQKLGDAWATAYNKGDAAAVAAMYTEDATVLPAGQPLVKGRKPIEELMRKVMQQLSDGKLTTVEVTPLGDATALEIGSFTAKTKGDKPEPVTGKYVVLWRRVDGQWKLATDIWNRDK